LVSFGQKLLPLKVSTEVPEVLATNSAYASPSDGRSEMITRSTEVGQFESGVFGPHTELTVGAGRSLEVIVRGAAEIVGNVNAVLSETNGKDSREYASFLSPKGWSMPSRFCPAASIDTATSKGTKDSDLAKAPRNSFVP
jgi:hypothetical protein